MKQKTRRDEKSNGSCSSGSRGFRNGKQVAIELNK